GTLSWADGEAGSKTFSVPILNDTVYEGNETFRVTLSGATGASLGSPSTATVTIVDNETPVRGTLQFSSSSYSVNENGGSVTITVTRTDGSYGAASVSYTTTDQTAVAGSDYITRSGTLSWADGEAGSKTFSVPILNDTVYEGNETFRVTLSGATGASLGSPSTATVTIVDDERPSVPPNDRFDAAIPMTAGVVYEMCTTAATSAGDPVPSCCRTFGKGVWYKFSPPATGTITVSTCDSDFDTVLALYTMTGDSLKELVSADDDGPTCSGRMASVRFTGTEGTMYYILVGGCKSEIGNLRIVATVEPQPAIVVVRQPGNIVLSWPVNAVGFSLECATDIVATNWRPVTQPVTVKGDRFVVTDALTGTARFYRLRKP
ncbi:MAG: hypothetical protein GX456_03600, partial [Verrucomicrobia bacterium]|nr:hypothetical protein [Verrucomicrobiota bacterium]